MQNQCGATHLPGCDCPQTVTEQPKSVLDGMPVKETGVPFGPSPQSKSQQSGDPLQIVGKCPHCGSPIYGQLFVHANAQPNVKHSCNCFRRQGLADNKELKVETKG